MTSESFLLTQIVYLLLALVSLWDYFRSRDLPHLVVALTFGSFGGFVLTQDLLALNGPTPFLYALNRFLLPLHAGLFLLLVNFFHPVPRLMRWAAFSGLLVVTAVDIVFGPQTHGGTGVFIIFYFVVFEAYAALMTVRGAQRAVGVTRRRLALAAAGTGLLALVVVFLLVAVFVVPLRSQIAWFVPLGTGLAAVCQYLGFATPRWLWEPWQLAELYAFLRQTRAGKALGPSGAAVGGLGIDERLSLVLDELCLAGARACGGQAAAVVLPTAVVLTTAVVLPAAVLPGGVSLPAGASEPLTLHAPPSQPLLQGALPDRRGAIARAWDGREAQVATAPADFGLPLPWLGSAAGVDTMLAVPILVGAKCWGLLLVFRRGQSPFVAADLRVLGLLAEQVAQSLEYSAVIGQLRRRTTQLEQANKELEAFSYSVSHDLRAPLRAMDGFSLALSEDYGHMLPAEALGYLDRIRAAAQRMGELVDDLLKLSQVTRAEMQTEAVDLSGLAQSVVDDLRQSQPGREVSIRIGEGLVAMGDARLLRLVLINLLGNAWKFTSKRAGATIEFGMTAPGGERPYFVRDNGAGFDMAYASRLFGVFQRLHLASDFPGTGIGLATVRRIVQRHGGRIWAEAAPDQGATFFFTIEPRAAEARIGANA